MPRTRTAKMPESGTRRRRIRMLAVGKPHVRPSCCPGTTRPRIEYGRPSRRAAPTRSRASSAARMPELLTRAESAATGAITSTSKPSLAPASRRKLALAAPPRPKWKSWPTTTPRACRRSVSKRTNASPSMPRSRASKRSSMRASRPLPASNRTRSRRLVSRAGGSAGVRNSRGNGSKVSITAGQGPCDIPDRRACATVASISAR